MSSAIINRNLVTQVNQDSGSLTSATTVVHKFGEGEHGGYKGVLYDRRAVAVGEFSISVGGDEPEKSEKHEGGHTGQHLPMSVEVDLTSLHPAAASAASQGSPTSDWDECECEDEGVGGALKVASEGYVVFKVPAGAAGGYAVELYKSAESGRGKKVFDSRALGRSDLLAVVLLRPGAYSVANASNGTKAELKVAYPGKPIGLIEPVKVTCGSAIRPDVITVQPTQGLVFSFETPSRVKIVLVTPEDRATPVAPKAPPSRASQGAVKYSRRLQLWPRARPPAKAQATQP
jgi:hypothetical protein